MATQSKENESNGLMLNGRDKNVVHRDEAASPVSSDAPADLVDAYAAHGITVVDSKNTNGKMDASSPVNGTDATDVRPTNTRKETDVRPTNTRKETDARPTNTRKETSLSVQTALDGGDVVSHAASPRPAEAKGNGPSPHGVSSPPYLSTTEQKKSSNLLQRLFNTNKNGLSPNASPPASPLLGPTEAFSPEDVRRSQNGDLSSLKVQESNASEKKNTGGSLRDMIAPKMHRKSSVTSRKSDGSERGSQHGGDSTATLLKKYGVCEKNAIGKGATAVVKLAHKFDRSTEKLYAVKEFRRRRKNETEKEYVKKLTSEFCISSTLHHINVVETVDLVQDENHHWCEVMEYCPGGDLYAAIKKGAMTSSEIDCCFKQIINGVAYLHSMGVAHRDIKPENLLLDGHGHIKITDLGVSDVFRMCWEKTTHLSKGLCGSEPYIAPEQFEQKEYDAREVDVWACGVVYYCMQYQELPWRVAKQTDPSYQAYAQIYDSSSNPPPLNNLNPRECRPLLKSMLHPKPSHRAKMEDILSNSWFQTIEFCDKDRISGHAHSAGWGDKS